MDKEIKNKLIEFKNELIIEREFYTKCLNKEIFDITKVKNTINCIRVICDSIDDAIFKYDSTNE